MQKLFLWNIPPRGCHLCGEQVAIEEVQRTHRNYHGKCVTLIKKEARALEAQINALSRKIGSWGSVSVFRQLAEEYAINAVASAAKSTIVSYCQNNKENELAHLFSTVGVKAVEKYFKDYQGNAARYCTVFEELNREDLKEDYRFE